MTYNRKTDQYPNRQSIRLNGYDYTDTGQYFITICTQYRKNLFGEIINKQMILNDPGRMVGKWWKKLAEKFNIQSQPFIVMPNHFYGIITIKNTPSANKTTPLGAHPFMQPSCPPDPPMRPDGMGENMVSLRGLGRYISWFKRMSTNEYIRGVKQNQWIRFNKKLWQRNYWEHIIKNDLESEHIHKYIVANPAAWNNDRLRIHADNKLMEKQEKYGSILWNHM